jgi:hypothetical protein
MNGVSFVVSGALSGALLVGGCGSSATVDTKVTPEAACGLRARAECDIRDRCSNGSSIIRIYGALAACVSSSERLCLTELARPETGATASTASRCAAEYATLSCGDFFDGKLPVDCVPSGPRDDSQPCEFPSECRTGYCGGTIVGSLCGRCAPPPLAGDSCAGSLCGPGQTCNQATMTCVAYGVLNTSCDANHPCGDGLVCVAQDAASSALGTCQKAVGELGAACGGSAPGCDESLGLFCGGPSGAQTCLAINYVDPGMPCGSLSATSFALCTASNCYNAQGMVSGAGVGTCQADNARDGAGPCDPVLGPACRPSETCVRPPGQDGGICVAPTAGACG